MLSHDSPLYRKYDTSLPYMWTRIANRVGKRDDGCWVRWVRTVTPSERKKHSRLNRSQRLARRFELERERRARRATPPHALRARNLHTPPPTCPPSRPAPALASRPPPKTAPPRYAARARRTLAGPSSEAVLRRGLVRVVTGDMLVEGCGGCGRGARAEEWRGERVSRARVQNAARAVEND